MRICNLLSVELIRNAPDTIPTKSGEKESAKAIPPVKAVPPDRIIDIESSAREADISILSMIPVIRR